MKHYLSRLSARIRAICILSALFLVPDIVQAEDVYLLTSQDINGTTGNYNVPNNHKFTNSSGTVYTYTITSMPTTGFWFRIGVDGWNNNMQPYTDGDALPINGDSYSITTDCYGKDKAWKVSYTKGEYNSLTITVDLSTSKRYVKITGEKNSTGGGGSSTSGDESADNSDTESTTAGYGVPDNFGGVILRYNSSTEPTNGNLYDWKDYFSVAYLTPDSKGFKSTFAPYFSNLIKDVSSHSEKEDGWDGYVVSMSQSSHPLSLTAYGNPKFLIGNWSNSTSWSVGSELNYTKPYLEKINSSYAGMLDFPLHTFIYNIEQGQYSDESVKGWQALTYLSQIAPTNNNRSSVVGSGRSNTWNSTTQSGKIDDFSSTHSTVVANGGYVTVIAQAIKDGALTGAIDTVTYRFNDYVPLNATITPPTATVNYGASLTPKVSVVDTDPKTRTYAFTIDGSNPTIDAAKGTGTGSTVVKKYDYDPVVPANDIYTFYMSATDQLTYIDFDGTEHTLDGNTVTVKAQAVQTINEGSKYRLEGDIATGTYVFKTAGTKPATEGYTISVTNDNQTDKPSINKVLAKVSVTNKDGKDDGVDVFYTIDGTDPAKVGNPGARLVKDRKIEVYGIVNLKHNAENYIRVAIAGSKPLGDIDDETTDDDVENGTTHASCKFDLTCSTSEGGYINYRDGYTDPKLKTYGGDGHIVVYILPWSSKYASLQETSGYIWVQNALDGYRSKEDLEDESKEDLEDESYDHNIDHVAGLRVPFIYAYENIVKDGVVESKALTHATHTIDVFTDVAEGLPTIPNQEEPETYPPYCWYYVDLAPDDNYKEVNVEVGYYDLVTGKWEFTPATIANVHNDMFLKFDVATGQIKDVTHEYTKDHFYTTGVGGTKSEPANPKAGERFFYAQVPEAWTINDNSVKVLQNGTVLSGATVDVQGSAETSYLSKVCKISGLESITEGAELTIQPYHGNQGSSQKLTINYVNGGYYFYESATHYTTNAPLVFSAYSDDDEDQRSYGRRDVNHTLETQPGLRVQETGYMGYGDYTYYLTPNWDYSPNTESKTTSVTNNWNGKSATVNTIAAGTTISQTVEGLPDGQYTVQMIVRGKENATATLQLVGSELQDYVKNEETGEEELVVVGKKSNFDPKTFAGYDAPGTITTDGRVEYLLKDTNNGWQKLETVASVGEEGKLKISLTADGGELQLSDVTLLCNANTPRGVNTDNKGKFLSYSYSPTIWTKAPTGSDVTEYDLTDRHGANEFSFFDRGDNRNAVIYADKNTVLGMSENTYNVAVPTVYKSDNNSEGSSAKGRTVFRAVSPGEQQTGLPFENATGHTLVWEDEPNAWVNNNTWGTSAQQITWDRFSWNRKFYSTGSGSGERNTIFLPFSMDENLIKTIFGEGAKIYQISSVNTTDLTVTGIQAKQTNPKTGESVIGTVPNVPYILELPEVKDGVSYNQSLTTWPSKFDNYSNATTIGSQGQFVGVYKYTKFNTKSDDSYDYYCYGAERNGIFDHFSDEGADIKPFRAYLRINRSAGSKPFYYFIVNDNETTGIEGVNASTLNEDAPVYNLQGQVIRQAGQHAPLPKGLYIQNGRKFMQQ